VAVTEPAPVAPPDAPPPTAPVVAAHDGLLRRQSLRESVARTYVRSLPIVPVRGHGLTVEGADGRRCLDCLSVVGTLALMSHFRSL
jgi:diaminobutyrate-2-oxoglutarate transaminase